MPKRVKCKHCKGDGYVYATSEELCWRCLDDDEKKKNCSYCERKGIVKTKSSYICADCGGTGFKEI